MLLQPFPRVNDRLIHRSEPQLVLGATMYQLPQFSSQSKADFMTLMKLLHYTADDRTWTKAIFLSYPIGGRAKAREDTVEGRRGNSTYLDKTIDAVLKKRRNPPMQR